MDKTIAYAITEEAYSSVVENVQVHDTNQLFYVTFDTILQELNHKNRNGRIYGDATGKALFTDELVELRKMKSWFGEAAHPITKDTARITTIDQKYASHRIDEVNVVGDIIRGKITTLDNGMYGNMMTRMILQGMVPAFSLRALAIIDNTSEGQIIQRQPRITTYDWVVLPSHKKAYQDESAPIEIIQQPLGEKGNIFTESAIPLTESMIIDFAKEESRNLNIVTEMFDVDTIRMSDDLKHLILTESHDKGTNKYMVVMDDHIDKEIQDYLTNL